ncbi:hypothetical protein DFP73DRAFT_569525 [Morchella snyderi]|nr:hypothetical protein DFP73DRAFT_569525 [Morchella snyderi]
MATALLTSRIHVFRIFFFLPIAGASNQILGWQLEWGIETRITHGGRKKKKQTAMRFNCAHLAADDQPDRSSKGSGGRRIDRRELEGKNKRKTNEKNERVSFPGKKNMGNWGNCYLALLEFHVGTGSAHVHA